MKRILTLMFATMLAGQAWAATTFIIGNLKYTVTDESNHYVSVGKGSTYPTGALEIPSQVTYPETDGVTYTVTELAYDAFYGCSGLTSVVIPNIVTVLGQNAFYNCSSLVSANIPDGVTEIRPGTFYNCKKLTSIIIPNSVTIIKSSAFQYCESLTSLNIPDAVVTINNSTFYGCKNLATVTLGNSLKEIGDYSFGLCTSLTSITFPNSIKTIGHDMFDGCTNLTSVNIPNGVTSIGEKTFRNCKSLTAITIPSSVTSIGSSAFAGCNAEINIESGNSSFSTEDGVLFNKNKTTLISCPTGKTGEYVIPNTVKNINSGAFYGCTNLTSITIPTGTTSIASSVFYNCSGLTSVTIPNSVTSIGSDIFRGCSKLTDINVESDNTKYTSENGVLYNKAKTNLICYPASKTGTTYTIPSSVTNISSYAFYNCIGLTSVTIPNLVASIGNSAFYNVKNIVYAGSATGKPWGAITCGIAADEDGFVYNDTEKTRLVGYIGNASNITIPSTVTSIGSNTFYNCSNLTSVIVPNTVTSIGSAAFAGCSSLQSITLPFVGDKTHSSTDTYQYPFGYIFGTNSYTGGIETRQIYYGNSTISTVETYYYIPSTLKEVTISGCKYLQSCAFSNCSGLTSVTIGNSITSIGDRAFASCTGLTSATIPNSVTSISYNIFIYCRGLTTVTIPNSVTSIGQGMFYGCSGLTTVTIPTSITSIGNNAFNGCSSLTSVTIPNSVTSIGGSAFGCSGLTSVTIPNSVTTINTRTFQYCSELTSVTIPNSVTSIGSYAFEGCGKLTSVTIPNTVTSIGSFAFYSCNSLTSVTIPQSVTSIGEYAFRNCSNLTDINVESDNTKYVSQDGVLFNKDMTTLICYPKGKAGTTYTIPNSVTSIGSYTFEGCGKLTSVAIPYSVTSIGGKAFYNCSGLTSVTIPESVTSIGGNAFYGCTGITSICYEGSNEPTYQSNSFTNVDQTIPVCVPEDYTSDTWCGFTNLYKGHDILTDPATVTCTEAGLTEGSHCSKCGKVFVAQEEVAALGHSYGEASYEWAEDGSSCKATTICQRDETHIATEDATITDEETIAPTCEEMGTTTYTAKFENELFATQTKDVVDIAALGHDYGTPTYEWAEDGSACTATTVCQRNENHIATEDATITDEETVAPTCEEMGTTTYTAKFENELFATQTKDVVDIDALGHSYGEASYEWAEDGSACTATAVCQRDENHIATEDATITDEETVAPTCEEMGTTTYTATFENELFTTQTKDVVDVPANGHSYNTTVTAPTCTEVGYTTHTCSVCEYTYYSDTVAANGHTEVVDAAIAATCTTAGKTEGKHCSVCEAVLVAQEEVAANGHIEVVDAAVAATCTTAGKTEGKHCSTCNAVIVAQTEVAALGHKFEKYTYNNDATTTADGTKTAICERGCGATDTKVAEGTKLPEKATAVPDEAANAVSIYAYNNIIVVENAAEDIFVYDAMGKLICRNVACRVHAEINVNAPGVYIVKTGNVTKRVMVF